jgi:L-amino acid N-acyltransferase YncA
MLILELEENHLAKVLSIYNYYIAHTTVSLHTVELSLDEIRNYLVSRNPRYKTYVIEDDGLVIGYALFTQHKNREAYDRTAELAIYLDPLFIGNKVGPKVITFLEEKAREAGYHVLIATICSENERSIRLFERLGYAKCAHFREGGYQFDRGLDRTSYQKILKDKRVTIQ